MQGETKRGWVQAVFQRREGLSTILMGLAAFMTTWCAFQASVWNGVQTLNFTAAAASRVESSRAEIANNQQQQVDLATFLAWLQALQAEMGPERIQSEGPYQPDPKTLSGFLYSRFRAEFRPVVQAWIAKRPLQNEDAPPTPFGMPEYQRPLAEKAQQHLQDAEEKGRVGRLANRIANRYTLTTVITALVVFFAGLSSKLTLKRNGVTLLIFATVALCVCFYILTRLPVSFTTTPTHLGFG